MNAKGMMSSEGSGAHRDTQIEARNTKHIRDRILQSASVVAMTAALFAAAPALAQTATAPAAANDSATVTEIVVTGTRIQTTGFTAPTPTSVIGEAQIQNNAQPNIFATIVQLPSLQGSSGSATNTFSTSSGQQGLSSFSLRGLGTIRTLTLLDGQRVVGAYYTGVTDVSLFPQLLIQRVDVVNGGASASYGSDAVGGVVNFITDTRFEGLKGNVQAGISKYNDNEQGLVQLAGGRSFAGDRVHVVGSVEWAKENGVGPGDFGLDLAGDRDWFTQTTMINRNVTNDGSPQYVMRDNAQPYAYTKYGLITAGPLQGIAFDQSGNPFQFQYGSNGVPSKTAGGAVTGCFPGFCVGGDLSGNVDSGRTLAVGDRAQGGLRPHRLRFRREQRSLRLVQPGSGQDQQPARQRHESDRPDAAVRQPVPARLGSGGLRDGGRHQLPVRRQQRCSAQHQGPHRSSPVSRRRRPEGQVRCSVHDWSYDAYYEHGVNKTAIDVDHIILTPRFNQAIQATTLNGAIVCADPIARANGCQPLNIFGGKAPSASALAYVQPEAGPFQRLRMTQDVASLNFSGAPVDLWAGPLSVAFGAEYRREFYTVRADPYGAGVADRSPNGGAYPADPLLRPSATTGTRATTRTATASTTSRKPSWKSTCRCSTTTPSAAPTSTPPRG
jgi:iron complex outermembrane receptor protein